MIISASILKSIFEFQTWIPNSGTVFFKYIFFFPGPADILERRKLSSFMSGADLISDNPPSPPQTMWAKQMMPSENSYNTYDTHHHNEKRFTDVLR